jgi:hypothetical protein
MVSISSLFSSNLYNFKYFVFMLTGSFFCLRKCAFRHCNGLYVLWACPQGFRCWEFEPQCGAAEMGRGLSEAGPVGGIWRLALVLFSGLLWGHVITSSATVLPRCCLPGSPQQIPADASAVPLNLHSCELSKPLLFRKFPFHVFYAGEKCSMWFTFVVNVTGLSDAYSSSRAHLRGFWKGMSREDWPLRALTKLMDSSSPWILWILYWHYFNHTSFS